ncbi:cupin domain-containing protein [Luteimonas composti]|uniref:Cupin domain-containing protein n=1 Tax=Luteimonas composti TaxID=398257 RepID=A0ABT6MS07_9GAMM|nr:cupin domain-containing protein [Luteimonas composti]MDH7453130.1 cupin domain-containing protein [Luteimonas composti]
MDDCAGHWIDALGLEPHPEGGYYRRIHASPLEVVVQGRRRPAMTAIRYLLEAGQRSAWHRVDADECWHWDDGGPLQLLLHREGDAAIEQYVLGAAGEGRATTCIVPAGVWQSARALDRHALATCVVAPGFLWEGFELLEPGTPLGWELSRLDVVQR